MRRDRSQDSSATSLLGTRFIKVHSKIFENTGYLTELYDGCSGHIWGPFWHPGRFFRNGSTVQSYGFTFACSLSMLLQIEHEVESRQADFDVLIAAVLANEHPLALTFVHVSSRTDRASRWMYKPDT